MCNSREVVGGSIIFIGKESDDRSRAPNEMPKKRVRRRTSAEPPSTSYLPIRIEAGGVLVGDLQPRNCHSNVNQISSLKNDGARRQLQRNSSGIVFG